jgi:radical SAM protein with 4Fe4S-binding SPASM domain
MGGFDMFRGLKKNHFLKRIKKGGLPGQFPTFYYIEVTSACNLKCKTCPRTYSNRKREHIDHEIFLKVIEEISKYIPQPRNIGFHFFGEALLNPSFFDYVNLTAKYLPNAKLAVSSNANFLDETKIDAILDSCLNSFGVWPDAIDQTTYDQVRSGGDYHRTNSMIMRLLEKRKIRNKEKDLEIHIGMVVNKINRRYIHKFIKKWRESFGRYENTHLYKNHSIDWAGQVPSETVLRSKKNTIFPIIYPCLSPFTTCIVTSSGDITCCCLDCNLKLKIGNIRGSSIKEIWSSEKSQEIRSKMIEMTFSLNDLCYHCHNYFRDPFNYLNDKIRAVVSPFDIQPWGKIDS